jgi:hypothetical protein
MSFVRCPVGLNKRLKTQCHDSETTSLCSHSLMIRDWRRSSKCSFRRYVDIDLVQIGITRNEHAINFSTQVVQGDINQIG